MKNKESATMVHLARALFRPAHPLGGGALHSVVPSPRSSAYPNPNPRRGPMICPGKWSCWHGGCAPTTGCNVSTKERQAL